MDAGTRTWSLIVIISSLYQLTVLNHSAICLIDDNDIMYGLRITLQFLVAYHKIWNDKICAIISAYYINIQD